MGFSLGNLSINEFIRRTGYNINEKDKLILEQHRQDNATIDPYSDKFHIFDIPFSIIVASSFKNELINILTKYEEISKSKESLIISEVVETEKEKEQRLKKEKEDKEWQEKLENPNSVWNVKWHMLVPVMINGKEYYYGCFINTYTTGRNNIPDTIDGKAYIEMTENGLSGRFTLFNPEIDNDADTHDDWNYVIGLGLYSTSGQYLGNVKKYMFERTEFFIAGCLNNTKNFDKFNREIHFDHIKE